MSDNTPGILSLFISSFWITPIKPLVSYLERCHEAHTSEGYMGWMDYLSGINWKNRNLFGRLLEHRTWTYDDCSCIVIGQMTPLCAFLDPHDDFDDSNTPESFRNAKLKFLRSNFVIPVFSEEYDRAMSNLCHIAHGLPNSIINDMLLSLQDDGSTMIKFSWDLFEDVRHWFFTTIMPTLCLTLFTLCRWKALGSSRPISMAQSLSIRSSNW